MVVKISPQSVPPLENGDHLTRDEFERRYEAMPNNIKAELIEGVVHRLSPVRAEYHGKPHGDLLAWFGQYRTFTAGVLSSVDSSIRLHDSNEPHPDAALLA